MKNVNEDHIKAVAFVKDFKKNNAKTVETVSVYDPIKRLWVLQKVAIDENAKAFYESTRPKREKKESVPKQVKTTNKKKETSFNIDSLRGQIYNLYKVGVDKSDIAKKFNIPVRRVSSEISKRNKQLGVRQIQRKSETRLKIEKLYKKKKTMAMISKELGLAKSTVFFHFQKIKKNNP